MTINLEEKIKFYFVIASSLLRFVKQIYYKMALKTYVLKNW